MAENEDSMPIRIRHEGNSLSQASITAGSVAIQSKPRNQQVLGDTNQRTLNKTITTNHTRLDSQNNIIIPGDLNSNSNKIKTAFKNIGLKISDSKDNGQTLLVYQNNTDIHESIKNQPSSLTNLFSKSKVDRKVLVIKLSESADYTIISVIDDNNSQGPDSTNITTLLFRELR